MSEQEVLENQLKRMRRVILSNDADKSKDDIFKDRIEDAKLVFLDRVYPYDKDINEIPERYNNWVSRCAIELYNLDEDGDYNSYSENALAWTRSEIGLSKKLLAELPPPQAGVPV
jgi:hypothetical protein